MLAFEAFRKRHEHRPDFTAWQRSARPLAALASLENILKLSSVVAFPRVVDPMPPPVAPPARDQPNHTEPEVSAPVETASAAALVLGHTISVTPAPVTFEPNEFMQHAAFLGGTGSGKTTAALNLIEQLLALDVPAVLLDRKGDLCRYADPAAWDRPIDDPARSADRQARRAKLDVALFTPGEPGGRPLALPVVPPGFNQLPVADRERFAQYAAAGLGSMIGFKSSSDADKGQRAILAKAIETVAAAPAAAITVATLRTVIDQQDDALLNAIGGGYHERYYKNLAERLLTLELNNKQLLTGEERLDVDALLGTGPHARPGRVRLSVISTRFLGDAAKVDFWVSQLLVAISRWCAKSPQPRLQAVFLFDEADLYLPAGTKQPATKAPMEDLLKRARSAGVGVFLATQSPGDFDYKCKENVRTWLIGRVKEPRARKAEADAGGGEGERYRQTRGAGDRRVLSRTRVDRDGGAIGSVVHAHRATARKPNYRIGAATRMLTKMPLRDSGRANHGVIRLGQSLPRPESRKALYMLERDQTQSTEEDKYEGLS